jgi:hypothetical protein
MNSIEFDLTLTNGTIKFNLKVKLLERNSSFEKYLIHPKSNPDKVFIIQNNRPLIRNKYKLDHKPLSWTVIKK